MTIITHVDTSQIVIEVKKATEKHFIFVLSVRIF